MSHSHTQPSPVNQSFSELDFPPEPIIRGQTPPDFKELEESSPTIHDTSVREFAESRDLSVKELEMYMREFSDSLYRAKFQEFTQSSDFTASIQRFGYPQVIDWHYGVPVTGADRELERFIRATIIGSIALLSTGAWALWTGVLSPITGGIGGLILLSILIFAVNLRRSIK